MKPPRRLEVQRLGEFLSWLSTQPLHASLSDGIEVTEIFALVALAALARADGSSPLRIDSTGDLNVARFARAVGLESVIANMPHSGAVEAGRTVPLRRFRLFGELEATATDVSRLLVPDPEMAETRLTLHYVLVELLRNVVQHSGDPLGGVVAAQLMRAGRGHYERDTIQVAVADAGMGIPRSMSGHHPEAADPRVGIERALWPHYSGAFPLGLSGSQDNAGLGLFFIAEMAKLTAGRLAVASRGATLTLQGDPDSGDPKQDLMSSEFPGTLVVFELALDEVKDFAALIGVVQQRAMERTPQREVHNWFLYDAPPPGILPILVSVAAENTAEARKFAEQVLLPRLGKREIMALDFRNHRTCTQSFLHTLLYEPLRVAWALRTPIYIVNAEPAVRSTLTLLESYALGG